MKNNKKGLSTIVATLLIILLTLVAVGIIWIVIRNVVNTGTQQIDVDAKCLSASVEATSVEDNGDGTYDVTIFRNGGDDLLGGVKLVFTGTVPGDGNVVADWRLDEDPAVAPVDHEPLEALGARQIGPFTVGITEPNKVSVVVYFLDDSGNQQLCSTANQYTFA